MIPEKFIFKINKEHCSIDRFNILFTTHNIAINLKNYALLNDVQVWSNALPEAQIKFWFLSLIHRRQPYILWPQKLDRKYNLITNVKSFVINLNKRTQIIALINYLKKRVMPFIDVEQQSISALNQPKQTLKLRNCTTPSDLHSLVLKTNISIDNIDLIFTKNFVKGDISGNSVSFICEALRLPLQDLLRRY